jgi:hypothetical protein
MRGLNAAAAPLLRSSVNRNVDIYSRAASRLAHVTCTLSPQIPSIRLFSGSTVTMSSPDITLYSWATPNGIKASIILEELGVPYKTVPIDISTNKQKEE